MDNNNFNQEQNNPYLNYTPDSSQNQGTNIPYEIIHQQELESKKGFAITSLVLGIISLLCCCIGILWPLAIVAIIFGVISLVQKKGGKGMAIGGIITGAVSFVLSLLMFISIVATFNTIGITLKDLMNDEEVQLKLKEYMEEEAEAEFERTGEYPDYYYQFHMDEEDWEKKYLFNTNGAVKGMDPSEYTYIQE